MQLSFKPLGLVFMLIGSTSQVVGKSTTECKSHCCEKFFRKHPSTKESEDAAHTCPDYSRMQGKLISCDSYRQAMWRRHNSFVVHPKYAKGDVLSATNGATIPTVAIPTWEHIKSARFLCYCELACEKKMGMLKELQTKVKLLKANQKNKEAAKNTAEELPQHYWGDKLKDVVPLSGVDDDEGTSVPKGGKLAKMPTSEQWFKKHVTKKQQTANVIYEMPPIADEGVIIAHDNGCQGISEMKDKFERAEFGDTVTIVAEGWIMPYMITKAVGNAVAAGVTADLQFGLTYMVGRPNSLPRGLNEGVIGMCNGETRVIVVPANLAYDRDVQRRSRGYDKVRFCIFASGYYG
jgi:hypothetical protein